jgi:hypothetical protein
MLKTRVLLLTTVTSLAVACGGSTVSAPAGTGDGGDHEASRRRDASADASLPEGGPLRDAGVIPDSVAHDTFVAAVCSMPTLVDDGGQQLGGGCAFALCPSGTVCVQSDSDLSSSATCVSIPPGCASTPDCACMQAQAHQCGGGLPADSGIGASCQDRTNGAGDASFIELPCGCA